MQQRSISHDQAQAIALQALTFLADDPTRMAHFLSVSGLNPDDLRQALTQPDFQAGVLTHIVSDEQLLLVFTSSQGLQPETVMKAQVLLAGRAQEYQST